MMLDTCKKGRLIARKKLVKMPTIICCLESKGYPMKPNPKPYIIKTKPKVNKYIVKMYFDSYDWCWDVSSINGVIILNGSYIYSNRTQCRNVAKKFADINGMKFKENK